MTKSQYTFFSGNDDILVLITFTIFLMHLTTPWNQVESLSKVTKHPQPFDCACDNGENEEISQKLDYGRFFTQFI